MAVKVSKSKSKETNQTSHNMSLRVKNDLYRRIMAYSRRKHMTKSKAMKHLIKIALVSNQKIARLRKLEQRESVHNEIISELSGQLSSVGNLLNQGIKDANYQVLRSKDIQSQKLIVLVNRVAKELHVIKEFLERSH